jgi:hypothetical protein
MSVFALSQKGPKARPSLSIQKRANTHVAVRLRSTFRPARTSPSPSAALARPSSFSCARLLPPLPTRRQQRQQPQRHRGTPAARSQTWRARAAPHWRWQAALRHGRAGCSLELLRCALICLRMFRSACTSSVGVRANVQAGAQLTDMPIHTP